MTLKLIHTRMDLELLNYINVDMRWNVMKKIRTSMTRRPRKPGADSYELVYNIWEPAAFERKKVVEAPSKKRRLLHQSTSSPAPILCINGENGPSPGRQTPSLNREDFGQRCWSSSLSKSQKTKSKIGLRKSKMKQARKVVLNFDDFSGIELLADVACSSFINENTDHVEDFSLSKKRRVEVNSCSVDVKEAIASPGSNGSSIQQNVVDNGAEVEEKKVAPSKGLRLHWDLNTVMDEWEDPCDYLLIESVKHDDASISVVPLLESCKIDSSAKAYELVEDLEVTGTKAVPVKTSDGESSASKSEVVDSLTCPVNYDDVFPSTTSLLRRQTVVNCESETKNGIKLDQQPVSNEVIQGFRVNKVATEDHVSQCCSKTVAIKSSYGESSASKSEVVDSLADPAKCEDLFTSTTSVLKEQMDVKGELDTIKGHKFDQQRVCDEVIQGFCDDKVIIEDHVSEGCCSNYTQEEQGHMAEGDSEEKIQGGYDSPFEDGELREPIEEPEEIYKDDFCTIERSLSARADHGQTMDNQCSLPVKEAIPNNKIEQGVQVDTFEKLHIDESGKDFCERKDGHDDESRPLGGNLSHIDESTSLDVCRNGEYIHRSRSGDSSMRVWDLKSHKSLDRNCSRGYSSRDSDYRTQDRKPSPSERNNVYVSHRGPPPARSRSSDRYKYQSQEFLDAIPCYSETKSHFSPSFNRPGIRSRSGSPIAWHFQKRKNWDTGNPSETKTESRGGHVSLERSSKCLDDHRRFRDGPFRDYRQAHAAMIQQKQRYHPIGYRERLKPYDYFRFNQRLARFQQMTGFKYKDHHDDIRKHGGYYEKVNRVGRSVDGVRRFRYDHHRN